MSALVSFVTVRRDPQRQSRRRYCVVETAPALITVAGGKYTTYRVMAEDTVDLAGKYLGGGIPKSTTRTTPILGADGFRLATTPGSGWRRITAST